ncbi:putative fasciclin-like arabinogalactan protein 20 [Punica granatum]|uniref:FAS1 domain-containing protein n=2 Tax=Punica granatum TaxID=22663 RepID=A0A218WDD3_PUNGR|nr:putative fasciclin-like arabinogalactan protein 20 [Punica granatum]OWM70340.1 hypothetical protein CDL15_Pgr004477 [Punica granatum]PKI61388.1 hypothetical protein CRG98_018236 [Punica granatum]
MAAAPLFFSLLLLSSTSAVTSPAENLQKAAEVLSDAHFSSMGLTLDLISDTHIIPPSPSLTVFSPRDSAFSRSGQPSLSLLQFHFSDLSLSSQFLRSLPFGTEIPTVLENRSLVVTTLPRDARVSLNGVRITNSPLYSDGSLVVFGADEFFNSSFQLPVPIQGHRTPNLLCASSIKNSQKSGFNFKADNLFEKASKVMRSSGYSVMASILGMQLLGIENPATLLTIFAPIDESITKRVRNFGEYPSIFLQHTVPCRLLWGDLVDIENGAVAIPTYRKGFRVHVTKSNDNKLMVNKVPIVRPELYKNEWIVVHGVGDLLEGSNRKGGDGSYPPTGGNGQGNNAVAMKNFKAMIVITAIFVHIF